jgi:hypothetical protein
METRIATANENSNASLIKANVSPLERILMITSGAYLVYRGTAKEDKSIGEISAGGALLLRGLIGYCPFYDAVDHLKNGKTA